MTTFERKSLFLQLPVFPGKYRASKHTRKKTKVDQINFSAHYALDFDIFDTDRKCMSYRFRKSLLLAVMPSV